MKRTGPAASVHIGGLAVVGWGDIEHLAGAVAGAARVRAGADPDDRDVGAAGADPGLQERDHIRRGQVPLVEGQLLILATLPAGSVPTEEA
jgi:hypothetical protein